MYNRPPLDTLTVQGSPLEIAFELGQQRRTQIQAAMAHRNRDLNPVIKSKSFDLKTFIQTAYTCAKEHAPHYLNEIKSMAEGADVSARELLYFNLTEIRPLLEKCTTLAIPYKHGTTTGVILGHNEDWGYARNDVFLLKARDTENNLSYVCVAYNGYLPGLSCGLNSHGVIHAINFLRPKDMRFGFPRHMIVRHLISTTGVRDMNAWIDSKPRAFGQCIHMVHNHRYRCFELAAKKHICMAPTLPFVHSNHYVAKRMQAWSHAATENSYVRRHTAQALVKQQLGNAPLTRAQALKIVKKTLGDSSHPEHPVWISGTQPGKTTATLVTAIFDSRRTAAEIYRHNPLTSKPIVLGLPT